MGKVRKWSKMQRDQVYFCGSREHELAEDK